MDAAVGDDRKTAIDDMRGTVAFYVSIKQYEKYYEGCILDLVQIIFHANDYRRATVMVDRALYADGGSARFEAPMLQMLFGEHVRACNR